MPQVDPGYGVGGDAPALPPVYTSTPTPNAGAATAPTNPILSSAPPPASGGSNGGTVQEWYQNYLASPEKKAADEATAQYAALAQQKAALDKEWELKDYNLARSQVASSGGGSYGAGLAEAEAIDKLNKEKAAHDLANQQEYAREALGSRGLGSSGQTAVEQGELTYAYNTLIKQIDLAAAARRASAAQAAANANRGISAQLARLDAEHAKYLAYQPYNDAVLAGQIADIRSQNENAAIKNFKTLNFDPNSGRYYGDDGTSISVGEAQQSIEVWNNADPATISTVNNLYATSANKNMGF